jgi:uncharacterized protein (TIGR02145 family)
MKEVRLILSAAVLTAVLFSSFGGGSEIAEASIEVTIGKQVWMTENLDVDKFRNGDPIPQAKTAKEWKKAGENKQPAWCYYNNDPESGAKYGKHYNWYAVNDPRGLAPEGWHIPSDAEWTMLTEYLGDEAGVKMKTKEGWKEDGNGTNESGFSGLPGGYRYPNGTFLNVDMYGYWWSSTEGGSDLSTQASAWYRYLSSKKGLWGWVYQWWGSKDLGLSVRCLRD